ncbi:MAG: DUF447 family protein [Pirellulales bacterium]|nr:DUF447 family protein [Pirellulales bacterium]
MTTPLSWPICEGLVVTDNESGQPHLAVMGPAISPDEANLTLRPFRTSTTYHHLQRKRHGVFHVTDDVELLVRAVTGECAEAPKFERTPGGSGWLLPTACRWMEFEVTEIDDSRQRSVMQARVVSAQWLRNFFGFNRAKHAVIEGAILATRLGLLDAAYIHEELARLAPLVEKTGTEVEHRAFDLLREFVVKNTCETELGQRVNVSR